MVLLVGWRGEPKINDHAQHQKQGKITPDLFQIMDIPYRILDRDDQSAIESTRWAIRHAKTTNNPTALIAKKGLFEKGKENNTIDMDIYCFNRETAIKCIVEYLPKETIYVATTGRATRELYYLREDLNDGHKNDFLNVGAMGHTSQIAMGIALGNIKRLVVCLDGDASAIMHLGGFSTIGMVRPSNLLHLVLNNGVHESVGGQHSAGYHINFTAIAEKSGYVTIGKAVKTKQELCEAINYLIKLKSPAFIDIHIQKGTRSNLKALNDDLLLLKEEFMKTLAAE